MSNTTQIDALATIGSGSGFPKKYQGQTSGKYPFYKVGDMNLPGNEERMTTSRNYISEEVRSELRAKVFPPGTIIFPKIGAAIATNKKRILTEPSCIDNNVMAAIPNSEFVSSEFLLLWFRSVDLSDFASDANPPSIKASTVKQWPVAIPSTDEQCHIVDILNRAASIERLRAQATAHLRDLIPALFIKMFGDPMDNPMGWEVKPLGEVVKAFQGGKNVQAGSGSSPYRILKVSAVTSGTFDPAEAKPAPDDYNPPQDHRLQIGDLLFSRANTAALVGATAVVESDAENLLLPDKLWRVVLPDDTSVLSEFLHGFLKMPSTRAAMSQLATGTSSSMQNISQAKLKTLPTILPPVGLQRRYTEVVERCRATSELLVRSGNQASALGNSISAEVF